MSELKMGNGKGLFMPEVTVEMFRTAPLEAVEEWLASGEVYDIDLKEELHREREQAYMKGYEDGAKRMREETLKGCDLWKLRENSRVNHTKFCNSCGAKMKGAEEK